MKIPATRLLLLLLVQYASGIEPDQLVQCFASTECVNYPVTGPHGNGYVTAAECCSGLGKSIQEKPGANELPFSCFHCLTAGFTESSRTISGNGTRHTLTVQGTAAISSTLSSLVLQLSVKELNSTRPISRILDLINYPLSTSPFSLSGAAGVQRFEVRIRPNENGIALQSNANYTLRLTVVSQPVDSVFLFTNRDLRLSIADPDILYIGFQRSTYTFSESDGQVSIAVSLSTAIAQTVRLRVAGGPSNQQLVVTSGTAINEVIEFTPGGSLVKTIKLTIIDDDVGLEDLEAFAVSLSLIGTDDERIELGSSVIGLYDKTIISITDDERINVQMQESVQRVNETAAAVNVCAVLSHPTVKDISIAFTTSEITASDPNDYIGGLQRKVFQSLQTCAMYSIVQDNEREDEETFRVSISELLPVDSSRLTLGSRTSTTVRIIDTNIETIEPSCIKDIDVMFILDSSGSIGQNNYTTMIGFVSVVAEHFEFGPDKARFGTVTFSTSASLDIPLRRHSNPYSFKKEVMTIPYKARTTNTAQAISVASNELITNGRTGTPQLIILFTDGQSNEPGDTLDEASKARAQGIRLLTIGIGPTINVTELNGIASRPTGNNVFRIGSFSKEDFVSILAPIVRETCEVLIGFSQSSYEISEDGSFIDVSFEVLNGTLNREIIVQFTFTAGTASTGDDFTGVSRSYTLTPAQTKASARFTIRDDSVPEQREFFTATISTSDEFVKVSVPNTRVNINDDDTQTCGADQLDLIVVLDSSGSILPEDFERAKQFVSQFTSEFLVNSGQVQVGVITFSNEAHIDIELGGIGTLNEFQQTVSQIPFRPGLTNTAAAIDAARQQFINNGHQNLPQAMVVITDGRSNDRDATLESAAILRAQGIEIFAIGIGSNVDSDELNAVASDPDSIHVSLLSDFSQTSFRSILKPLAQKVCEPTCQRQIDFVFVMDSSASIGVARFGVLKQFLSKLVGQYNVSQEAAWFGVVRYSSSASVVITLGSVDSVNSLQSAIVAVAYGPGSTNTAQGIQLAMQQFVLYGRQQVPKVMIVLTDGESNSLQETRRAAELSKEQGIEIFAVGIGSNVRRSELLTIATEPTSMYVFTVTGFNGQAFDKVLGNIVRSTCNVPACRTPPLDIIFALDGSSSVSVSNFMTLLNFVVDVINQYRIDRASGTQVGVVTFSQSAARTISLTQFQTRESLSDAIVRIQYPGGGTNTHLALRDVRAEFNANRRPGARQLLVMVTDGLSNNPAATRTQAQQARDEDIEIFSIGIGSGANQQELREIASDPDSNHVFTISDYTAQSFSGISQSLTRGICRKPVVCSHAADIVFIIDSSTNSLNFQDLKQFVVETVSEVTISQTATRVAIVQYSSGASLVVSLADHRDTQSLIASIVALEGLSGQSRNTGAAIDLAHSEIRENGRAGVARVIFVITSGPSSDLDSAISSANIDDITVATIGLSSNRAELQDIASTPNFVFALNDLTISSLRSIRKPTVGIICTQEPQCQLNMIFVLDASVSLSSASFQSLNNFLIRIVNQYDVSSSTTRIGIVSFGGSSSSGNIAVGSISDQTELIRAIQNRQQVTGSGARTLNVGLNTAYRQILSLQSASSNVIVVITTGLSDDLTDTARVSQLIHSLENTEVFTISVSTDTSEEFANELNEVATKPSADHVFRLESFQSRSLNSIFNSLVREFCDDDSNVVADPMFTVPLSGTSSNTPLLCYEVYGTSDKYFNMISDRCVSINAHYTKVPAFKSSRPLHLIDQFGIRAISGQSDCVDIGISLERNHCLVTYNGAVLRGEFRRGNVHLLASDDHISLSIPNCDRGTIVLRIQKKLLLGQTKKAFLELQVESGLGITPSAHGLIGQFWNASVKIDRKGIKLRATNQQNSRIDKSQVYAIAFLNADGTVKKRVSALLQRHTWGTTNAPCLYAGDSEGGYLYEVLEPNSTLLEGNYLDYTVSDLFSTEYKNSRFKKEFLCSS